MPAEHDTHSSHIVGEILDFSPPSQVRTYIEPVDALWQLAAWTQLWWRGRSADRR